MYSKIHSSLKPAQALIVALWFALLLSCDGPQSPETETKQESLALSLAMQAQEQEKSDLKTAVETTTTLSTVVLPEKSVDRVDVILRFKGISSQYQGYFAAEGALKIMENGLDLPSPVMVEIRWVDAGHNRGTGEIVVYVEKPITRFVELQREANTLMAYRKWIGANLDLRILAFDLVLEGDGCRLPIVKHSALQEALISPCLERDGQKICASVMDDGSKRYSSKLRAVIADCFHRY